MNKFNFWELLKELFSPQGELGARLACGYKLGVVLPPWEQKVLEYYMRKDRRI
jgi:hypothetical protein